MSKILTDCIYNATPFVSIKTRIRGKQTKYKINFLEKEKGERKSISALVQNLKVNSKKSFKFRFENELENLANGKSNILVKRNALHNLALKNTPFFFFFKT